MFGRKLKRFTALVGIMLLCAGMMVGAFADEEAPNDADTDAAMDTAPDEAADVQPDAAHSARLVRSKVADLGKVPDETKMEKRCEVLLVADFATGVPVREKNVRLEIPVAGAAVQMMTVLTAMDYYALDEWIAVTEGQLRRTPESKVRLGLNARNEVLVSDLVAAMLLTGAADAAQVLADATVKRADADSIGELMQAKADWLGLTATNYYGCDGVCSDTQVTTNAMDQCELYLTLMDNEGIADILAAGIYETGSRYDLEATAALADEETERSKRVETDEEGRVRKKNNGNIPATIRNAVKAVVPEERAYDVRLSSAVSSVSSTAKKEGRYGQVFFRARSDRSDLVMLYWQEGGSSNVPANNLIYLTDTFNRSRVVDLIPYIEVATASLTVEKNGLKIGGWSLQSGHAMYGRVLSAYDPEAYAKVNQEATDEEYLLADMKVLLKADVGTMATNDDGSRTMQAKVLVDNSVEGTVVLETAPKAIQTEISQKTNTVYTDSDIIPEEPTLMSQYGWMIIIAAVVLLGLIVIIIGVAIRNRMER